MEWWKLPMQSINSRNWARRLQCDYYNRGHLNKVDQLDDRKINVHSEKVNYNLQPTDMTSVEPAEGTIRFLRKPLECWRREKE